MTELLYTGVRTSGYETCAMDTIQTVVLAPDMMIDDPEQNA